MTHNYIIGTGYYREHDRSEDFFRDFWYPNTERAEPSRIVVTLAASRPPFPPVGKNAAALISWIDLPVNPQCGRRLKKNVLFAGWSLSFIHGAVFAYSCGCDYIYKEQDCLAFGPWVEQLYQEAGTRSMVCGELYDFPRPGYLEQSLVLLKYDYIMPFLSALMAIPQGEGKMKPEQKFSHVMKRDPDRCGFFKFGYGGNRPFQMDDPVFYIQKPRWNYQTRQIIRTPIGSLVPDVELLQLREKGLLEWPKRKMS